MKATENHLKHLALAMAAVAGLAAGSAQAQTTSQTFELGTSPANTNFPTNGASSLTVWIAKGSLPAGSTLRKVTATNLKLETNLDDAYASDIGVFIDTSPETPGGPDGLLSISSLSNFGGAASQLNWGGGNDNGPFTLSRTDSDWTGDIDLSTAAVMLGSGYGTNTAYSGSITVEYDIFVPAAIASFGPGAVVGELSGNAADIAWTVPTGTDVTTLAPTFTLSSGACDKPSGSTQDFTNPVVYTVTDGGDSNVYTVTVTVANGMQWNVAGDGDWDLTTANWLPLPSGAATTFTNGNEAIFDNAAGGTISIASGIEPLLTTVNAASGTYFFVGGPIATGSLTKDGGGTLRFMGVAEIPPTGPGTPLSHTYPGGTVINGGTLTLGGTINGESPNVVDPLGTGAVTLNNGTLFLSRVQMSNDLVVNGGSIYQQNGWGATWSGPITLNATTNFDTFYTLNVSGDIGGTGGLTKTLNGPLNLSGTNSYTGPTSVTAGTMTCNSPDALGGGDLSISAGTAKLNLDYTGTKTVASVTLNGVLQTAPGTYGALTSDAAFKSAYFDGAGTVTTGDPATAAYILSFGTNVTGSTAVIDPVAANAAAISWIVPAGTDLATLAADFVLTAGATCSDQTSGVAPTPGFDTGPVDYTVVSQNTTVTNTYTVSVTVLEPEADLIWNLASGGDWDFSTANWRGATSGNPTPFFNDVNVTFDNTAGGTIAIDPEVSPLSTTVNAASGTYTFVGPEGIATGSLVKDGDGQLWIYSDNGFDGGTTINAGVLRWNFDNQVSDQLVDGLGTGPVTMNGGQLFLWRVNAANDLIVNGGSLYSSNGFGNIWNGTMTLNADLPITPQFKMFIHGLISGTGGLVIENQSDAVTLTADNTYEGATLINSGQLRINGDHSAATGAVTVANSGTLGGDGTIGSAVTVSSAGAAINPGGVVPGGWPPPPPIGTLTVDNDVTISGSLEINLDDTRTPQNDTLAVGGALDITAATLDLQVAGSPFGVGYVIATYGTLVPATGPFATVLNLPDGYEIDYAYNSGTAIAVVQIGGDTPFDTWATDAGGSFLGTLTDPTATVDFDLGGLQTGIEWAVGGDPTDPTDDAGLAPTGTVDETGTYLVFTYQRADAANDDENTSIKVEYDADLQGTWTEAQDTVDDVVVEVTEGSPSDTVVVKIPLSLAAPGTTLFARLNVVVASPQ